MRRNALKSNAVAGFFSLNVTTIARTCWADVASFAPLTVLAQRERCDGRHFPGYAAARSQRQIQHCMEPQVGPKTP